MKLSFVKNKLPSNDFDPYILGVLFGYDYNYGNSDAVKYEKVISIKHHIY